VSAAKATLREPLPPSLAPPPPSQGTWREGAPSPIEPSSFAPPPPAAAPAPPASRPLQSQWPPRPAAPQAKVSEQPRFDRIHDPATAPTRADRVFDSAPEPANVDRIRDPVPGPARAPAPPASHAWSEFAIASAPAPAASPASRQPPGLGIDGRPDWFVQGTRMYQDSEPLSAPAGAAPALEAPAEHARASAAPRMTAKPAAVGGPARAPIQNVGVHLGREAAADDEPPALLRFALRAGLGLSLFVILTTVRHCRAIDSDVHDALAAWGVQPQDEIAAAEPGEAAGRPATYGPPALPWLASDLHQVSSADKDRVVSLVKRFKRAGATEVYMGNIMRSGVVQIAGELIIELPSDEQARAAVLAEHERVLESSFGGFAPKGADPDGPVLRLTL
jgi:hypothetical protein